MKLLLLLLAWLFALPAFAQTKPWPYQLVLDDDSIYVEQFSPAETDENRFTANNTIYVVDRQWVYDYHYKAKNKKTYWFTATSGANGSDSAWRWVSPDSAGSTTVRQVRLRVTAGLGPFVNFPGYNQTIIQYDYLDANGPSSFNEQTGVVENERNVWMHPPRTNFFRILELNPFPYIQAPYRTGHRWQWHLTIGDSWQDARWKTWSGRIENRYQYEIKGIQSVKTPIGTFSCYKVHATATNRLGHTQLTAYFNQQVGFVRLEYTNIDGSKTVLSLNKVMPIAVSVRKP